MIQMITKLRYKFLKRYRHIYGYGYRGLKKVVRLASYHHNNMDIKLHALGTILTMKVRNDVVEKADIRNYKKKWRRLNPSIPDSFMCIYPAFTRIKSSDFVPSTIYYNLIEPILNNYKYSISFADKNMYARLFDKDVQPDVLLRKMHGQYLDYDYKQVVNVDGQIKNIAKREGRKYIMKPAIASRGGRKIFLLKSKNGYLLNEKQQITREWLDTNMGDNFLIQRFVQQHPFYAQFNPSSLNTMRVYTYRSVKDNATHVLHAMLRVGKEGSLVDNMSGGGKAIGISQDGKFHFKANNSRGEVFTEVGGVNLSLGIDVLRFKEVEKKAKEIAATQFYSRFIGFDFCVDENEKVWLIEINNIDIGIESIQRSNGPLFREFTDEVIEYCEKHKKGFRYQIL